MRKSPCYVKIDIECKARWIRGTISCKYTPTLVYIIWLQVSLYYNKYMSEKYILIAYMLIVSFKTRTQSFWQDYKGV